ncbi:hypothetical protein [Acinetobacter baumannii]|uniref:hypothetical protein n=1 Tax=Acinetobacter baumannii TaxID=470 RepID=UPI001D184044|nr:hypothetical protein [Acinetobacter baumannii]
MAERSKDSNGVLNDDRIRNTQLLRIIEEQQQIIINATTSAIAEATASLDTMQTKIIQALSAIIKDNQDDQQSYSKHRNH